MSPNWRAEDTTFTLSRAREQTDVQQAVEKSYPTPKFQQKCIHCSLTSTSAFIRHFNIWPAFPTCLPLESTFIVVCLAICATHWSVRSIAMATMTDAFGPAIALVPAHLSPGTNFPLARVCGISRSLKHKESNNINFGLSDFFDSVYSDTRNILQFGN